MFSVRAVPSEYKCFGVHARGFRGMSRFSRIVVPIGADAPTPVWHENRGAGTAYERVGPGGPWVGRDGDGTLFVATPMEPASSTLPMRDRRQHTNKAVRSWRRRTLAALQAAGLNAGDLSTSLERLHLAGLTPQEVVVEARVARAERGVATHG